MLNSMNIVGRPTTDPELRYTPEGVAIASVIVAVQRNFKNAQGEYDADFVKVVAWKQSAEYVANYARKGKLISVDGAYRSGSYENDAGNKVYTFELHANNVNVLEWEEESDNKGNSNQKNGGGGSGNNNRSGNNGNTRNGNNNRSGNGNTRGNGNNRNSQSRVDNDNF